MTVFLVLSFTFAAIRRAGGASTAGCRQGMSAPAPGYSPVANSLPDMPDVPRGATALATYSRKITSA